MKKTLPWIALLICFIILFFMSLENYLVFHMITEVFTILIAGAVFIITLNAKKYFKNSYLVFLGITYLFIAILDLFHTMTYTGMPIYTHLNYPANQLWIAARYYESIALLIAFSYIYKRKVNTTKVYIINILITSVVLLSILWLEIFPECFIDGIGLTTFKKVSEYIISFILVVVVYIIFKRRKDFSKYQFKYLVLALMSTIISELLFTFYISNYGISNLFGHYFKVLSFIFIYLVIVKEGVQDPYALIFKELEESRLELDLLAYVDPLTGLANRRKLQEGFQILREKALKEQKWLSLVILDIDDFKLYNDKYGHDHGDEVLKDLSKALANTVHTKHDIVSRHGGEEFLIVFYDCDYNCSVNMTEKIHKEVKTLNYCINDTRKLTVSIGFVSFNYTFKDSIKELIKIADKHLYSAKASGKNISSGVKFDK